MNLLTSALAILSGLLSAAAYAADKPNILVIMDDDIGIYNLSAYHQGMMGYNDWWYRRSFIAMPVQNIVGKTLTSFKNFPPRQKPASFTIDQAMEALIRTTSPGSK